MVIPLMIRIKHIVKRLLPSSLIRFFSKVKITLDDKRRLNMTVKEIFTEIYDNKLWGNGLNKFYSGPGSAEEPMVQPYIQKISDFLRAYIPKKPRIVDLGCGN